MDDEPGFSRGLSRRFFLAAAGALAVTGCSITREAGPKERFLNLVNPPARESLALTYFIDGDYVRNAVARISWFMRDPWNNKTIAMDPELLDMIHELHLNLGGDRALQMLSAYRSPESNARMARRNRKVAKNSLHMYGKAVDLRLPNRDLDRLERAARPLNRGGLGIYRRSRSRHIHLDTGPRRIWYG